MKLFTLYPQDFEQTPHLKQLVWPNNNMPTNYTHVQIQMDHPNFDFIYLCVGDQLPELGFGQLFDTDSRWHHM